MIIDALDRGSYIRIIPSENKIIGYTTRNRGRVAENFKNYFVIIFDKPFDYTYTFADSIISSHTEEKCNHAGAIIGFNHTKRGEVIQAKVASSFISPGQAEINLKEIGNDSFETIKNKARAAWNKVLGKVKVSGGSTDQLRGFYPVTAASLQYAAGAPLFKHAEIDFENGKKLYINAPDNSPDNRYIQTLNFNGKHYTRAWYGHFDLLRGGTINIQMGQKPDHLQVNGAI